MFSYYHNHHALCLLMRQGKYECSFHSLRQNWTKLYFTTIPSYWWNIELLWEKKSRSWTSLSSFSPNTTSLCKDNFKVSRDVQKIISQIEIVAFLSFSEISGVRQTEYGYESQSYNMKNKKSQRRLQQLFWKLPFIMPFSSDLYYICLHLSKSHRNMWSNMNSWWRMWKEMSEFSCWCSQLQRMAVFLSCSVPLWNGKICL